MTKDDRYGATHDTYDDAVPSEPADDATDAADIEEPPSTEPESDDADDGLPFIFARRTVKADREAVPVYLQSETASDVQTVERDLTERFDGDKVMSLDVREALVRAGLRNQDDVEAVMEEWGYGRR